MLRRQRPGMGQEHLAVGPERGLRMHLGRERYPKAIVAEARCRGEKYLYEKAKPNGESDFYPAPNPVADPAADPRCLSPTEFRLSVYEVEGLPNSSLKEDWRGRAVSGCRRILRRSSSQLRSSNSVDQAKAKLAPPPRLSGRKSLRRGRQRLLIAPSSITHRIGPRGTRFSSSSSVKRRERVRNRRPSGPSSENIPPRPGTTSMMS